MLEKIISFMDKYICIEYEQKFKLIGKVLGFLSIILITKKCLVGEITVSTFFVIFSLVFSLALGFSRFSRLVRPSSELMRTMNAQVFNTSFPSYGQNGWLKLRLREYYYSIAHVVLADFFLVWVVTAILGMILIVIVKLVN